MKIGTKMKLVVEKINETQVRQESHSNDPNLDMYDYIFYMVGSVIKELAETADITLDEALEQVVKIGGDFVITYSKIPVKSLINGGEA